MEPNVPKAPVTWRVFGLELQLGEPEALVRERACRELGIDPARVRGFRLVRKALDARKKNGERRLRFVLCADIVVDAGFRSARLARAERSGTVRRAPPAADLDPRVVHPSWRAHPGAHVAVVGSGPAGLFAAIVLARGGVRVTIVDRGSVLERRGSELVAFHRTRTPNPESNLLYGEGGAGTYSDGKIYTRVDDPLEVPILEEIVACGAKPDILYDSRAHIGTDRLHFILPKLRARMAELGVRFAWNTRVDGIVHDHGRVRALQTSAGDIAVDAVVFAPGHSARDTWAALAEQGVAFEAKPFQLGVRIEHPQELVTRGQFGDGPEVASLGAASYGLVSRAAGGVPATHSFCMCPGGRIVASVSEHGYLCTNGMSNSTHSSRYANAALVTTFTPAEFGNGPFDGVAFQRALEQRFFDAGGGDYHAPAQRASDFFAGRASRGEMRTSFGFGVVPARVDELVPELLRDALRRALTQFERSITGFAGDDGILVGLESRSSGPVRMPRDFKTRRARGFVNFMPVGEGAGFAGGIMSAALDGAHSALALLEHGLID
ncbi:MAG: NAD(P)/FAD-dependent oxidoreductase [Planctomycetes bacterium]|nr:NAD(P)/FAD-dependent oxidoreductase [Planctomycetota bacterium]